MMAMMAAIGGGVIFEMELLRAQTHGLVEAWAQVPPANIQQPQVQLQPPAPSSPQDAPQAEAGTNGKPQPEPPTVDRNTTHGPTSGRSTQPEPGGLFTGSWMPLNASEIGVPSGKNDGAPPTSGLGAKPATVDSGTPHGPTPERSTTGEPQPEAQKTTVAADAAPAEDQAQNANATAAQGQYTVSGQSFRIAAEPPRPPLRRGLQQGDGVPACYAGNLQARTPRGPRRHSAPPPAAILIPQARKTPSWPRSWANSSLF
jgi:hypothetical protein